jgi:hypothetical protein
LPRSAAVRGSPLSSDLASGTLPGRV